MDRYQLKNVIIIILLLVNLFLMGMVGVRVRSEQEARRRTAEELDRKSTRLNSSHMA